MCEDLVKKGGMMCEDLVKKGGMMCEDLVKKGGMMCEALADQERRDDVRGFGRIWQEVTCRFHDDDGDAEFMANGLEESEHGRHVGGDGTTKQKCAECNMTTWVVPQSSTFQRHLWRKIRAPGVQELH